MNRALELHDSVLQLVDSMGTDLILLLAPAYIHETVGDPGNSPGRGYWQHAQVRLRGGRVVSPGGTLPRGISEGTLTIAGVEHRNLVPLPQSAVGRCTLLLTLDDGSTYVTEGAGVNIDVHGAPRNPEAFSGA